MPSVGVPEQVAKNQLVVQKNAAQVDVLEQERWASPPADEIRRALSDDLAAQLGTIDVANSATPPGVPVYRISVNVQRFESWPGKRAAVDAVWSVRSLATQAVMTCRTSVAEPVADGYDALVAGHRRALDVIATQAAAGVRAMAARRGTAAATAPAAGSKTAAAPVVPCPANPTSGGDAGATASPARKRARRRRALDGVLAYAGSGSVTGIVDDALAAVGVAAPPASRHAHRPNGLFALFVKVGRNRRHAMRSACVFRPD